MTSIMASEGDVQYGLDADQIRVDCLRTGSTEIGVILLPAGEIMSDYNSRYGGGSGKATPMVMLERVQEGARNLKEGLLRKSNAIGLRAASYAVTAPPKLKPKYQRNHSLEPSANFRIMSFTHGISLVRAARDGLLDVVEGHLKAQSSRVHEVDEDGYTALHHAARYNRTNVLKCLVDGGANVNVEGGPEDARPLHMACRYNSSSAVQFLLAQGAEVSARDSKGRTPLHYATRRGHDVVTKMLLSVSSCDVDAADSDSTTPLHMAAIQGNRAICEILVLRGACVRARDINDMTALMWASCEGHCDVVRYLIDCASKYLCIEPFVKCADNEGNTALHFAVQNGKIKVCEILIKEGSDVNGQKYNLATPLHIVAMHGFDDIAELLIASGADVNRPDSDHMTPMHKAATYNKVEIMKILLRHGGNPNSKDRKNKSPLHCACWKGQTEAAQFLLDNGAQVAESDSSLMTALHWAVQFGHYNTLSIILKRTGNALLGASDKNEQTALHYAANSGNVLVMKTLLDYGARTDTKDQEERTPLHIAAQNDNVHCVESLIEASPHEINDDDVDGRTPLLLAALNGHHLVVQVLLSLGGDISNKDDEHRTALMLAAAEGHTTVMKILLENHAPVNEVDKTKNTALHYACSGGYVEAVAMLLDKRADVTFKNTFDQAPLDLAVDNNRSDVAAVMLNHKTWRNAMSVRGSDGRHILDRLIARLPAACKTVLDHCVERSSRDDHDENLTMVFDYFYVDPGPDDPASKGNRYSALNTMVSHGREGLLSHPVCQNLLSQKWVRYGRSLFVLNLLVYAGYLSSLTSYTYVLGSETISKTYDNISRCPIMNEADLNQTDIDYIIQHGVPRSTLVVKQAGATTVTYILTLFVVLFFLREFFKFLMQRLQYLFNIYSWIACFMVAATWVFIHPIGQYPCLTQWRAGWMANFLAWINLLMYIRKIDFLGIYVIMFVAVLGSLLKAVLVYFFFCWAFAGSFFIITTGKHDAFGSLLMSFINTLVMTTGEIEFSENFVNQSFEPFHYDVYLLLIIFLFIMSIVLMNLMPAFKTFGYSLVNVITMTLGEIEFADNFVTQDFAPFEWDVYLLLVVFLFLMPIVLMNLMIGVAVGDIEKIQKNAYLKRIALQVELLYNTENIMPKFLQRRFYVRKATIRPNENRAFYDKLKRTFFGSSKSLAFIDEVKKDKLQTTIEKLDRELIQQDQRIKNLQLGLQQQTSILHQIASKLNIDGGMGDNTSMLHNPDQTSYYDNMASAYTQQGLTTRSPRQSRKERTISGLSGLGY